MVANQPGTARPRFWAFVAAIINAAVTCLGVVADGYGLSNAYPYIPKFMQEEGLLSLGWVYISQPFWRLFLVCFIFVVGIGWWFLWDRRTTFTLYLAYTLFFSLIVFLGGTYVIHHQHRVRVADHMIVIVNAKEGTEAQRFLNLVRDTATELSSEAFPWQVYPRTSLAYFDDDDQSYRRFDQNTPYHHILWINYRERNISEEVVRTSVQMLSFEMEFEDWYNTFPAAQPPALMVASINPDDSAYTDSAKGMRERMRGALLLHGARILYVGGEYKRAWNILKTLREHYQTTERDDQEDDKASYYYLLALLTMWAAKTPDSEIESVDLRLAHRELLIGAAHLQALPAGTNPDYRPLYLAQVALAIGDSALLVRLVEQKLIPFDDEMVCDKKDPRTLTLLYLKGQVLLTSPVPDPLAQSPSFIERLAVELQNCAKELSKSCEGKDLAALPPPQRSFCQDRIAIFLLAGKLYTRAADKTALLPISGQPHDEFDPYETARETLHATWEMDEAYLPAIEALYQFCMREDTRPSCERAKIPIPELAEELGVILSTSLDRDMNLVSLPLDLSGWMLPFDLFGQLPTAQSALYLSCGAQTGYLDQAGFGILLTEELSFNAPNRYTVNLAKALRTHYRETLIRLNTDLKQFEARCLTTLHLRDENGVETQQRFWVAAVPALHWDIGAPDNATYPVTLSVALLPTEEGHLRDAISRFVYTAPNVFSPLAASTPPQDSPPPPPLPASQLAVRLCALPWPAEVPAPPTLTPELREDCVNEGRRPLLWELGQSEVEGRIQVSGWGTYLLGAVLVYCPTPYPQIGQTLNCAAPGGEIPLLQIHRKESLNQPG